jgi:hypothetical protein
MDPNAALRRFLDALAKGDRAEATEAITDLQEWIAKGGFLPTDPRKAAYDAGSQDEVQADLDTFDAFVSSKASRRAFFGRDDNA